MKIAPCIGIFVLCWAHVIFAQTPTTAPVDLQSRIDKAIDRLSSDDVLERDRASYDLEYLPAAALPKLRAMAQDATVSPEVRKRLQKALPRMEARAKLAAHIRAAQLAATKCRNELLAAAYENDGHTSPAWDGLAHEYLHLITTKPAQPTKELDEKIYQTLASLIAAGCDDPTILATGGLRAADHGESAQAVFNDFLRAQSMAEKGKCDPYTKIVIDGRIIRGHFAGLGGGASADQLPECRRVWKDMTTQFQQLSKSPGVVAALFDEVADNMVKTAQAGKLPTQRLLDEVFPIMESAFPNDSKLLTMKGSQYINFAWEARGSGWGNTVGDVQAAQYADRLKSAEAALTKAYELDPLNSEACTLMLTVMLGKETDIPQMEQWFQRAMTADPDNYQACSNKLYYLEPKWHGSPEAMLAFAHQCVNDANWRKGIPFILAEAHYKLCFYEQNPSDYFTHGNVWDDINSVYTAYFRLFPKAPIARSKYAFYACMCKQWKVANEQFNLIGDKPDIELFKTQECYDQFRRQAALLGK